MKKEAGFVFVLIIFFTQSVFAVSGVSPGSYDVNFEAGIEKDFNFRFIFDENVISKLSVEGELSKYVVLNKYKIFGSENVTATIKLPEKIENPGSNKIRIGAKQILPGEGGIGISSDVGAIINIFVPYPGKYIESKLIIPDGNIEETNFVFLNVKNLGNSTIKISPIVQIFLDDEKITSVDFDLMEIPILQDYQFKKELRINSPGEYGAVSLINYEDGTFERDETFFRVGELFVKVNDYKKTLNKTPIEEFNFEIENLWNKKIEKLYANISFHGHNFSSPFIELDPWEKKNMTIYIDSTKLGGRVEADLILNYEGRSHTEKIFFNVEEKIEFYLYTIILVVLFLVFYFFIKKRNKIKRRRIW
ncbi:MAG: hypothetical protein WC548_03035 [Candidatus Pacearchaeota archaeon]